MSELCDRNFDMALREINFLLDSAMDDLELGFIGEALEKLGEAVRMDASDLVAVSLAEDDPSHIGGKSIAQAPKKGQKWVKVRPSKFDKPGAQLKFHSILHKWHDHVETEGVEDNAQNLAAFMHKHFGYLSPERVKKVVRKNYASHDPEEVAHHFRKIAAKGKENEAAYSPKTYEASMRGFKNRFLRKRG
jgi:hypothetical protein